MANTLPAYLLITGTTVTEDSGFATWAVKLSQSVSTAVTFQAAINGGTATAPDYVGHMEYSLDGKTWISADEGVTIPAGVKTVQLRVALQNDAVYEGNESISVELTGISNNVAHASNVSATTTITDKSDVPVVSSIGIDHFVSQEGDEGGQTFTIHLSNTSASETSIHLDLASPNGNANSSADLQESLVGSSVEYFAADGITSLGTGHVSEDGSVQLPAGAQSFKISFHTQSDNLFEGVESYSLSAETSYQKGAPVSATGVIIDSENLPTVSIEANGPVEETNATENGDLIYTVHLSEASSSDVVVKFTLGSQGTYEANNGSDYVVYMLDANGDPVVDQNGDPISLTPISTNGGLTEYQITIPAGSDIGKFEVHSLNDGVTGDADNLDSSGNEYVTATITSAETHGIDLLHPKSFQNNGFGNGDQTAPGESGPHNNAENAGDVSAEYEDYPGNSYHTQSHGANGPYQAKDFTWNATSDAEGLKAVGVIHESDSSKVVTVSLVQDDEGAPIHDGTKVDDEGSVTYKLNIDNSDGATIGNDVYVKVTITDNDDASFSEVRFIKVVDESNPNHEFSIEMSSEMHADDFTVTVDGFVQLVDADYPNDPDFYAEITNSNIEYSTVEDETLLTDSFIVKDDHITISLVAQDTNTTDIDSGYQVVDDEGAVTYTIVVDAGSQANLDGLYAEVHTNAPGSENDSTVYVSLAAAAEEGGQDFTAFTATSDMHADDVTVSITDVVSIDGEGSVITEAQVDENELTVTAVNTEGDDANDPALDTGVDYTIQTIDSNGDVIADADGSDTVTVADDTVYISLSNDAEGEAIDDEGSVKYTISLKDVDGNAIESEDDVYVKIQVEGEESVRYIKVEAGSTSADFMIDATEDMHGLTLTVTALGIYTSNAGTTAADADYQLSEEDPVAVDFSVIDDSPVNDNNEEDLTISVRSALPLSGYTGLTAPDPDEITVFITDVNGSTSSSVVDESNHQLTLGGVNLVWEKHGSELWAVTNDANKTVALKVSVSVDSVSGEINYTTTVLKAIDKVVVDVFKVSAAKSGNYDPANNEYLKFTSTTSSNELKISGFYDSGSGNTTTAQKVSVATQGIGVANNSIENTLITGSNSDGKGEALVLELKYAASSVGIRLDQLDVGDIALIQAYDSAGNLVQIYGNAGVLADELKVYGTSTGGSTAADQFISITSANHDITKIVLSAIQTNSNGYSLMISDIYVYDTDATIGVVAQAADGTATPISSDVLDITLVDLGNLTGSSNIINGMSGNDTLNGTSANEIIYGEAGNDVISAGAGNDYLIGGLGSDTLTGGDGNDHFVFSGATIASNGEDHIQDFSAGDIISLLAAGTTATTADGLAGVWGDVTKTAKSGFALSIAKVSGNNGFSSYDVIEFSSGDSSNKGNLDLSTSGTELFKILSNSATVGSGISGLTVDATNAEAYLIAYDNSKAYIYYANSGADTNIASNEIELIGVVNNVAAGALTAADIVMS